MELTWCRIYRNHGFGFKASRVSSLLLTPKQAFYALEFVFFESITIHHPGKRSPQDPNT